MKKGDWGPWNFGKKKIRVVKNSNNLTDKNFFTLALMSGVKFFRKFISPIDGDRCPMYPTCSHYSMQALKKHGAILGLIMTSDRLLHEIDEQKHAPLIIVYKNYRYFDPVENNDFWWDK